MRIPQTRLARATRMGTMTAGVAGNMAFNGLMQLGRGQQPTARDLLLTPGNISPVSIDISCPIFIAAPRMRAS
ncbi:MAG: hypothetical protein AAFQ60_16030 [Pseudomonadota bacterium]